MTRSVTIIPLTMLYLDRKQPQLGFTTAMPGIGHTWWPDPRPTARRWNSIL